MGELAANLPRQRTSSLVCPWQITTDVRKRFSAEPVLFDFSATSITQTGGGKVVGKKNKRRKGKIHWVRQELRHKLLTAVLTTVMPQRGRACCSSLSRHRMPVMSHRMSPQQRRTPLQATRTLDAAMEPISTTPQSDSSYWNAASDNLGRK